MVDELTVWESSEFSYELQRKLSTLKKYKSGEKVSVAFSLDGGGLTYLPATIMGLDIGRITPYYIVRIDRGDRKSTYTLPSSAIHSINALGFTPVNPMRDALGLLLREMQTTRIA